MKTIARNEVKLFTATLIAVGLLTGCSPRDEAHATATGDTKPALVSVSGYRLSSNAARARDYLDNEAFETAQQFFRQTLPTTSDAGLACQYVRFLLLSRDPAVSGFIETPLRKSDANPGWWAAGIASQAFQLAVEIDPKCKSYLADLVFESFARSAEAMLKEKRGIIGISQVMYLPELDRLVTHRGSELSMINLCWSALSLDSAAGKRWCDRYERIMTGYVKLGKVASAMMMGNLVGDLKQGGKGAEDFHTANKAFCEALDHYVPDGPYDWVQEAADAYPECFRDELLEINSGAAMSPGFADLKSRLARYDVAIPGVTVLARKERIMPAGAAPK